MWLYTTILLLEAAAKALAYGAVNCTGINAISPKCRSNETAMIRDFFYIGGNYQFYSALNSDIYVNAMYVEKLTPPEGVEKPYPIVLFTASVPSGAVSILFVPQLTFEKPFACIFRKWR
jgi:hypothetical protein